MRRVQFRISHVLIAMSLLAVLLTVVTLPSSHVRYQSRERNRLQRLVTQKGGFVDVQGGLVVGVQLDGEAIVDKDLEAIDWLRLDTLRWVVLRSPGLTDSSIGIMRLKEASGLGYVDVRDSQITIPILYELHCKHRCRCVHDYWAFNPTGGTL